MAFAVIVAAGRGKRMNCPVAKQYLQIGGKPLFVRTLEVFAAHPEISVIQLVVPPVDIDFCKNSMPSELDAMAEIRVTAGGEKRQESVYQGLLGLDGDDEIVVIHDGVRPFVTSGLISACIKGAGETGACIAAIPASDTLKRVDSGNIIENTLPRDRIWQAQTPQVFVLGIIKSAFEKAVKEGFYGTDDASLVERTGRAVAVTQGSPLNLKITTPGDIEVAERIFQTLKTPIRNAEVGNVK
ncbi:MAG: 2-C-methyl-D-erythritol 4-phosphate cytidylyltransferase [Desulfobacteraceae bacterium]|nr:2-C-methyl-D-erythritol 4-phosphate cytidylyltransferase [Desulfobacteraceae bacterium]